MQEPYTLIAEHELFFCSSKREIHWSSRTFQNLPVFYITFLFCASVSPLWRNTWDNEIRTRKRLFWGLEWEILVYVHLVCCFGSVMTQYSMQAHRVVGLIWWCSGNRKRGRRLHEISVSLSWKTSIKLFILVRTQLLRILQHSNRNMDWEKKALNS